MERKFTVKYKPADGSRSAQPEKPEKRNLDTFDSETDHDIFALGDAAQESNFNPDQMDEIFKTFGISLADIQGQLGEGKVVTKFQVKRTPFATVDEAEEDFLPVPLPDGSEGTVVHTETKTLPGGQRVRTKIIKGPIQRRTKIIQRTIGPDGNVVTKEATSPMVPVRNLSCPIMGQSTDSGSTENDDIKSEYEYGPSRDDNAIMPLLPDHQSGPLVDIPRNVTPPFVPHALPPLAPPPGRTTCITEYETPPFPTENEKPSNLQELIPQEMPELAEPSDDRPPPSPKPPPSPIINRRRESSICIPHYPGFDRPDVILTPKTYKKRLPWLNNNKVRSGRGNKRPEELQLRKGKIGMCASQVGQVQNLPAVSVLVANYARMLVEELAQFVDTMFRAIKLNNFDVSKILCKIVQKSGLKLSNDALREPESSATVLHVALLYNHENLVDYLLQSKDVDLILAKYTNEEYRNQTSLHVAVANGNISVVEKLLLSLDITTRQELVNTVAEGNYFQNKHPNGQLCLSAAAWAGQGDIIKILVKYGADLGLKNLFGNTILHCIIYLSLEYTQRHFKELLQDVWEAAGVKAEQTVAENDTRNAQKKALLQKQTQVNIFKGLMSIRNNEGYTPLSLSALESSSVFNEFINMETLYKIPQNKLGSIAWVTFDVTEVTSFSYDTYNKFSVIHILAHTSHRLSRHASLENEEEDFLNLEPISSLLQCKWRVYRWVYIVWCITHILYMLVFTALTANTNSCPAEEYQINNTDKILYRETSVNHINIGFAGFLFLPIINLILELLDLYGNHPYRVQFMSNQNYIKRVVQSVQAEWTITGNGPYRFVNVMFSTMVILWFFLYFSNHPAQDMALAMALLLGWIFILFFTRGCRVTCRFSVMIQKMFFRDLLYFLTVYVIVLVGFSFAMNATMNYKEDAENTMSRVIYDMMNVVTDLDDKMSAEYMKQARYELFAKLLLIMYAIFAVILLMNMLIAMMNTSYETVRVTRCNLYKQQVLSVLLLIERRFFWWKWLCQLSEMDVWRNESDDEIRCYMDVTVLNTDQKPPKKKSVSTPASLPASPGKH